ncbi:MAG: large conductance mechanosensitive channel protein MscL [Nitriliruptoraceae bacterium]
MIAEFKEFISRGNMVEMAVAFVLGVAFQSVISAITDRVLTPLIAWVFGEPDFDSVLTFGVVDPETGVPTGSVGAVLTALLSFFLVAVALFLIVKAYNRLQRQGDSTEPEPEAEPADVVLLREIRDALSSDGAGERGSLAP